jgi:serine/threonine protein kinase
VLQVRETKSRDSNLFSRLLTPWLEIIRGTYDEKCDLWSIGVITYLLLSGETPFGGLDGENMLLVRQNIMRAQVTFKPTDVWANVSPAGKAFVKKLLQADPDKRPTAKDAQKDEWIQVWAKKVCSILCMIRYFCSHPHRNSFFRPRTPRKAVNLMQKPSSH